VPVVASDAVAWVVAEPPDLEVRVAVDVFEVLDLRVQASAPSLASSPELPEPHSPVIPFQISGLRSAAPLRPVSSAAGFKPEVRWYWSWPKRDFILVSLAPPETPVKSLISLRLYKYAMRPATCGAAKDVPV
jgi:hypothetical protein